MISVQRNSAGVDARPPRSRIHVAFRVLAILATASSLAWSQHPGTSGPDGLVAFFRTFDRAVVAKDWATLNDQWNLDARKRAERFLSPFAGKDVRGHESRILSFDRIGDTFCVHVQSTSLTRLNTGPDLRSTFDGESTEDYLFLMLVDGPTFRILQAERLRGPVTFAPNRDHIACNACNFRVRPEPGWFHVHFHGASVRSAESIRMVHISGRITLELQVVERLDEVHPAEEIEWDEKSSLVGLDLRSLRVIRDGVLNETSHLFRSHERDVAIKDLSGEELRIWRIYRARENVLYAMTAFGQAAAFDVELTGLERMFHSFEILDPLVTPREQMRRMIELHSPQLLMIDGLYKNEENDYEMVGPDGWLFHGNSAGARWIRQDDQGRELASLKLTSSPPSRVGWGDAERIQRTIKEWERTFQKSKTVRRGSLKQLHPVRCRPHRDDPEDSLSTLCYKVDYAYETAEGTPHRLRVYLVPMGKLLHRVLCDAPTLGFDEFDSAFEDAVGSLRVPLVGDRKGYRRGR